MSTDPAARRLSHIATLLVAATLVGTWGLLGVRVAAADEPISVEGLLAALAFTVAGIGCGVLLMSLASGRARRKGLPVPAPGAEDMVAFFLLFGLLNAGFGVEPAFEQNPTAWTWLPLLVSLAGGAFIGVALVLGVGARAGGTDPDAAHG